MTHYDPEGPVTALTRGGHTTPIWAGREVRDVHGGTTRWAYEIGFLSTTALIPIAHLLVDGWEVKVDNKNRSLLITIKKK